MLLFAPILAATSAGTMAGVVSLAFLRPRQSCVVLVSVATLYFPVLFWWSFGLYVGVYPLLPLRGMLPIVAPPACWSLLCGAWIVMRFRRDARGRATSSSVYVKRLLQLGGAAIVAFIAIGIEGMSRAVDAGHGAVHPPPPHLFLATSAGIMLAFIALVYVRERDPEIALLLLVVAIGAVVPIVGLGRLAAA